MWLLWFSSHQNSVDFIGLYPTEAAAEKDKESAGTPWHKRNGSFKISFVEISG